VEKDTEQRRAEIREELASEPGRGQTATGTDDEEHDPEGHEPLPGLVGNRLKDASEPERR
jgi:hypothetical protein